MQSSRRQKAAKHLLEIKERAGRSHRRREAGS
jgi:hypothetical protein